MDVEVRRICIDVSLSKKAVREQLCEETYFCCFSVGLRWKRPDIGLPRNTTKHRLELTSLAALGKGRYPLLSPSPHPLFLDHLGQHTPERSYPEWEPNLRIVGVFNRLSTGQPGLEDRRVKFFQPLFRGHLHRLQLVLGPVRRFVYDTGICRS